MNQISVNKSSPLEMLSDTRSFRDVDPETLQAFVAASRIRTVSAGEALFRSGEAYDERVYVLFRGEMLMRRPGGVEMDVQAGDFLGLANYLDRQPHTSSAVAQTNVSVLEVPATVLHELEQHHPSLFNALNRILAEKLRDRRPDRQVESGALAEPVSTVMKSPVASCGPGMTLQEAFLFMRERRIGSCVVTDADGRLLGLLTYAGLAEAMLLKDAQPADSILKVACEEARVITASTPLWKAEELQQRYNAKYLIVVEGENPIGMISQTDMLRAVMAQHTAFSSLASDAQNIKELADISSRVAEFAAKAREAHRRPTTAVRFLSENHLAIQRRGIELALEWMEDHGHGKPPLPFSVLIMGSGGRKEMLLNPDQDNAIIIGDAPETKDKEQQDWFERFTKRVNRNLDRTGYPLCPGDIMARNPMYRKTLSEWKEQISNVASKPTDKAARWANVMFDFDTLYGDDSLTTELRRHTLAELEQQPRLLSLMAAHDAEGKPALGFFNQLITTTKDDRGEHIDIKRNGLRIVADVARIFALQSGVAATNTVDRLTGLVRVGKLSDDFATSVAEGFDELLDLLLAHQLRQASNNKKLDKLINPDKISASARSSLRMAMRAVKRFQDRLQDDYGSDVF